MDYRAEIIKLLDDITDEGTLVYLWEFLRLHIAKYCSTDDRA